MLDKFKTYQVHHSNSIFGGATDEGTGGATDEGTGRIPD